MEFRHTLARGPSAPREGRRCLDPFASMIPHQVMTDAGVVISELVTNAVIHNPDGPSTIELVLRLRAHHVRIEVRDDGLPFIPRVPHRDLDAAAGRGLLIVDRFAERWGVLLDHGTCVWAQLRV